MVDACHYATKEVVLENVINIDKELRKVGIENPLIAVAGLNPHNGDNGLFGREEIDELEPAVKAAQEMGINAVGPCPADSVFHIGKSGKYDAVICVGAVIRGDTSHYDLVCNESAKGIAQVELATGIPVLFGVITTENIEQAIARAGSKAGNKGYDCALSAIEMVNLMKQL